MRRHAGFVGAGLAILVAAVPSPVHAQVADAGSDRDPQSQARAAMLEGLADADRGAWETALAKFRRAAELVPEANLPHRHAARTLEELGRWDDAVTEYETYLRIKADVSDAASIRDRVAEIRRTRLVGTLTLACDPLPAEVFVDANLLTLGAARDLQLSPGPHHVRLRGPGYVTRDLDVTVPAGGSVATDCTLERAAPPSTATVAPLPPPAASGHREWYSRWYTWAGAGAVVAVGATVATILLVGAGSSAPPSTAGGNHRFP